MVNIIPVPESGDREQDVEVNANTQASNEGANLRLREDYGVRIRRFPPAMVNINQVVFIPGLIFLWSLLNGQPILGQMLPFIFMACAGIDLLDANSSRPQAMDKLDMNKDENETPVDESKTDAHVNTTTDTTGECSPENKCSTLCTGTVTDKESACFSSEAITSSTEAITNELLGACCNVTEDYRVVKTGNNKEITITRETASRLSKHPQYRSTQIIQHITPGSKRSTMYLSQQQHPKPTDPVLNSKKEFFHKGKSRQLHPPSPNLHSSTNMESELDPHCKKKEHPVSLVDGLPGGAIKRNEEPTTQQSNELHFLMDHETVMDWLDLNVTKKPGSTIKCKASPTSRLQRLKSC